MNNGKDNIINNWLRKSEERAESARNELQAKHLEIAVSHLYYSMFYAVTGALVAMESPPLTKHTAVKSAFHRDFIKPGLIDTKYGKLYQKLFDYRHKADYSPITEFEYDEIREQLDHVEQFVLEIKKIIHSI